MKIYILTEEFWGNREEVRGIYSTMEKAKAAAEAHGWGNYSVITRELDAPAFADDGEVTEEAA